MIPVLVRLVNLYNGRRRAPGRTKDLEVIAELEVLREETTRGE